MKLARALVYPRKVQFSVLLLGGTNNREVIKGRRPNTGKLMPAAMCSVRQVDSPDHYCHSTIS